MRPLGDRIIVKLIAEDEVSAGGVILPDAARERPESGTVEAVGRGFRNEDGSFTPLEVEVGDEVLYSKYGGTEVTVEGEEVLVLRESDVLAVLASAGDAS